MDSEILYRRIKKRRLELGLSQKELAIRLGYTDRSTISRIENFEVDLPIPKIEAFAKALETTPAYLMGWDDDEIVPASMDCPDDARQALINELIDLNLSLESLTEVIQYAQYLKGKE